MCKHKPLLAFIPSPKGNGFSAQDFIKLWRSDIEKAPKNDSVSRSVFYEKLVGFLFRVCLFFFRLFFCFVFVCGIDRVLKKLCLALFRHHIVGHVGKQSFQGCGVEYDFPASFKLNSNGFSVFISWPVDVFDLIRIGEAETAAFGPLLFFKFDKFQNKSSFL